MLNLNQNCLYIYIYFLENVTPMDTIPHKRNSISQRYGCFGGVKPRKYKSTEVNLEHLARKQDSTPQLIRSNQKLIEPSLRGLLLAKCESIWALKRIMTVTDYQSIDTFFFKSLIPQSQNQEQQGKGFFSLQRNASQ